MNTTLAVAAIENGTVIDHIPAGQALSIIRLLKLDQHFNQVTLGLNLPSYRLGRKDLIKIEGRVISHQEIHEIAVFAPHASINLIHDFNVGEKIIATLPDTLIGILRCPNTACVSRDAGIASHFKISAWRDEVKLACHYCEREFNRTEIKEYTK